MADYRRLRISEVPVTVVRFTDPSLSNPWVGMGEVSLRDPFGEIREVGAELQRLVEEGHTHLLLNFCDVQFISTTMLGELINLRKQVIARQGTLTLTNLSPDILKVFTVMKLDKLFNIRADESDALPSI